MVEAGVIPVEPKESVVGDGVGKEKSEGGAARGPGVKLNKERGGTAGSEDGEATRGL